MAPLAAGLRRLLGIIGKIARFMLGATGTMPDIAMAMLATLAPGLGCLFSILSKMARIMAPATAATFIRRAHEE
ncbi:hypothetical protein GLI01_34870 [Gluconacetobacter liquefaciens]|nr:hypothetical protein GLI01_34870 [Gluconacetobacter liquefaciens]